MCGSVHSTQCDSPHAARRVSCRHSVQSREEQSQYAVCIFYILPPIHEKANTGSGVPRRPYSFNVGFRWVLFRYSRRKIDVLSPWTDPTPSPRSDADCTAGRSISPAMLAILADFYAEQLVELHSSSKLVTNCRTRVSSAVSRCCAHY